MQTPSSRKRIVIIGGVALGAGTAAKARRNDENAEIIVIERGPYVSFANCGLPYHLGGVIADRNALVLHTPESLKARFEIDVRVRQEVIAIDRADKRIVVRRLDDGQTYEQPYDKLVLAMGAKPISPNLPGKALAGIFQMRSVPDIDAMKTWIEAGHVRRVAVIGAGFIGLETVENLVRLGLDVTLVEKAPQVLPPFDPEMTAVVLPELDRLGVRTLVGDGITGFTGHERVDGVDLESGAHIVADMVIMGLGVRPDTSLVGPLGLETGTAGALRVNDRLQTSDPDIYAGGDVAEITHLVDNQRRWIPLAGPANKQARVIGANVCGGDATFRGAQGTAIVRLGNVTLGVTGFTEKLARSAEQAVAVSYNTSTHHAGYYPGAEPMTIKLLANPTTGRVMGAQIAGGQGVDKRIDVLATAIYAGLTVAQVAELDLGYSPPFSSAKDPVVLAAMAADNVLKGKVTAVDTLDEIDGATVRVLDVRDDHETVVGMLSGATHIPLNQLRARSGELDPSATWIVYCQSGQRSYYACKILEARGFERVYNLKGGYIVDQMRRRVDASRFAPAAR